MRSTYLEGFVELFRNSPVALAATPAEQVACLSELGVAGAAAAALIAVDATLAELTHGPAELWSEDGLTTAPGWQTVRDLSATALRCLPPSTAGSRGGASSSRPLTAT